MIRMAFKLEIVGGGGRFTLHKSVRNVKYVLALKVEQSY